MKSLTEYLTVSLSREEAQALCEALELESYMQDEEEIELMLENNPELHAAQVKLYFLGESFEKKL